MTAGLDYAREAISGTSLRARVDTVVATVELGVTALGLKQGFAWWSLAEQPVPQLLERAREIGYSGVDFLPQELWGQARSLGYELAIIDGHESIEVGFNDRSQHADLFAQVRRNLDLAVAHGVRALSVAPGDRVGISDSEALVVCAEALIPLAELAGQAGVMLLMEPLNSKVDHIGHQCDSTAWGVSLLELVGSPWLKLLFDGYHMQIMEGDLIRTIEANIDRIGHFHTAGVPGRHELDDLQEVNWKGVGAALDRLGYSGYVSHEFIPRGDAVAGLRQAYALFDR